MATLRNEISKLIQQIQKNNSIIDSLKPSLFESVVAEAVIRNNELINISKKYSESLDFVGKFRDKLGKINSFAIETKQLQKAVETTDL